MYTIVEITKYPLTPDYEQPILNFIGRLKEYDALDITVGETSTVVRGDYDKIMEILTREMRTSLDGEVRTSFVLKVLNVE
jgi:uncharacterized protein YqgV (UPF0045/DUF77 family)